MLNRAVVTGGLVLLLAGLMITGCKKESDTGAPDASQVPTGVTDEHSAMKYFALNDEFVANGTAAFADPVMAPTNYNDGLARTDAAITPVRWGRFITSVTSNVTVETLPGDTLSVSHVERMVTGTLKIRTTSTGADSVVSKAFVDRSTRNVIFRRVARDSRRFWMNWMPVASTLENGGTVQAPAGSAIAISRLEFTGGDTTITVENPDSTWLRYRWRLMFNGPRGSVPELKLGDSIFVRVTVQSQAADTDLVVLRNGFGARHFERARMNMISQTGPNAEGFYTRVYEMRLRPRLNSDPMRSGISYLHVGIDAITRGTLFDSTAPYSASWWGMPYRMF